jgi:adenosylcobinamide kinase/adenosylcobinamide-phosphate guanylyltransferase
MSLTFIIGGARSGKSSFAEMKANEYGKDVLYIASAVVTDEAMADRVKKHRDQRPKSWKTIEMYSDFKELSNHIEFNESEVVILDCITTLIGNFMHDSKIDFEKCCMDDVNRLEKKITEEVLCLVETCNKANKKLIIVSNEVGMGVVPSYYMGNYFRDISGRVNNRLGKECEFMYFIFSGIPIKLKHNGVLLTWPRDF